MTDGNVVSDIDRHCPDCGQRYIRIKERDEMSVVFVCECGRQWRVYFVRQK